MQAFSVVLFPVLWEEVILSNLFFHTKVLKYLSTQFVQAFNGKKWEKFNSEKVASLAYARIQGKVALVTHFQNSSLMNEDKRCRPILFQSEGQEFVDQVIKFVCFPLLLLLS